MNQFKLSKTLTGDLQKRQWFFDLDSSFVGISSESFGITIAVLN